MSVERSVFKERMYGCRACGEMVTRLAWNYDPAPDCCGESMTETFHSANAAHGVIGDDIPGGLEVRHAICNPDGTPRKFYSKSAIREAARQAGWTIGGETPKPPNCDGFRD